MLNGFTAQTIQNDGAGGKPQFFTLLNSPEAFSNLIWEIICMTADDIARSGGMAAVMDNDINAKKVTKENFHLVEALFKGMEKALQKAGLVNITGEFAIMKHSVTAFCDTGKDDQLILNWSGSCTGLTSADKLIDGSEIYPEMPIVGFLEPGYRCNGGTFFTNLLLHVYGKNIDAIQKNSEAMRFVEKLTVPSLSYARAIMHMNGWNDDGSTSDKVVDMRGIAHITGGGVWGKFGEILPRGIGSKFFNMPVPADVLLEAQEMSWNIPGLKLPDLQAYSTFHGGCGMLVVCDTNKDSRILVEASREYGIEAAVVGITTKSENNEILIDSQFKEKRTLSSEEFKK